MTFKLDEAMRVLSATPHVLQALLQDLPPEWVRVTEGPGTWSAYDVVGHLIHGEKTDWMARVRVILEQGASGTFEPFDREAQFRESAGRPLHDLLNEFGRLRAANLRDLAALDLQRTDLDAQARHPALGPVTLRQLLATWVAHDCDHLMQLARLVARPYADQVGPWRAYLRVISGQQG